MNWHLIEGAEGCAYAVANRCVAVVVDALRASATAAMLLHAGASELIVVRQVHEAFAASKAFPNALLFGERAGLPPEGFDCGNSPRTVEAARGRRVIFTTTTGAQRLIQAWGAKAVYMGTTLNAQAVIQAARRHDTDIVLIPAGLAGEPGFNAQEDWAAATAMAMAAGETVECGADRFRYWRERIRTDGILRLFETAPHAAKLRDAGLGDDIAYCAQIDVTTAVPQAVAHAGPGLVVRNAQPIA